MIEVVACIRHRNVLGAWSWLFMAALWPSVEIGHGEPIALIADCSHPLEGLCLLAALARTEQMRMAARFN